MELLLIITGVFLSIGMAIALVYGLVVGSLIGFVWLADKGCRFVLSKKGCHLKQDANAPFPYLNKVLLRIKKRQRELDASLAETGQQSWQKYCPTFTRWYQKNHT